MQRLNQIIYYLRESPALAAGFVMVSIVVLFGLLGPLFVDTSLAQPLSTTPRMEPSWEHPLVRMIQGATCCPLWLLEYR